MSPRHLIVSALVLGAVLIGGALLVREQFGGGSPERETVTTTPSIGRSEALARTRLLGTIEAMDSFVLEQRARCDAQPDTAEEWRVLAESCLERCLLRDTNKGMAVGRTTHQKLPETHRADLDAALLAIDRAIELGDSDPDAHRIRSSILSLSATTWTDLLAVRPKVEASLRSAEALDPNHPRVVLARACEKLFAPNRFFGQDPAAAERMFQRVAEVLRLDERPFVLAAMCAYLLDRRTDAIENLEKAIARNPSNSYAREVPRRLRANEPEPFARDVSSDR